MSLIAWRDAVLSSQGPQEPSSRLVACALAKHADAGGGRVFPSERTLAAETGLSRKTVRHHLRLLEAAGWVAVRAGAGGGQGWRRHSYVLQQPEGGVVTTPRQEVKVGPSLPHVTDEGGVISDQNVGSSLPLKASIESVTPPAREKVGAQLPHVTANGKSFDSEAFERFWSAYPNRMGGNPKKAALRKWKATLRRNGCTPDQLITAAQHYARHCDADGATGTRYVKQATTFLGPDEHWRDYLEVADAGADPIESSQQALAAIEAGGTGGH